MPVPDWRRALFVALSDLECSILSWTYATNEAAQQSIAGFTRGRRTSVSGSTSFGGKTARTDTTGRPRRRNSAPAAPWSESHPLPTRRRSRGRGRLRRCHQSSLGSILQEGWFRRSHSARRSTQWSPKCRIGNAVSEDIPERPIQAAFKDLADLGG